MSYAATAALQEAVFSALSNDSNVVTLSAGAIYDAIPPGDVPSLYISLGPETARDASDVMEAAALHEFLVKIVSDEAGFHSAKRLAAAVSDVLTDANLALSRGTLAGLRFRRARARKSGDLREIDLWFRAFIDSSAA
ncbi:DUF3168 domain-containing protein [Gymnodinialimonas sp. 2305UL16-5]|uniref:DUF3168 domain-containing protein n=1 Tax=Gymnodinialimonas mytili TaxID=3126503 RepID=UPI00309903B5